MLARGKGSEAEAWDRFRRLRAVASPGQPYRVRDLMEAFLESKCRAAERGELARVTYATYVRLLSAAARAIGHLPAADLRPYHVDRWIDATPWGSTGRRNAITAVKAVLAWARRSGLIDSDPIEGLAKPPAARRRDFPAGRLIRALIHTLREDRDPLADVVEALFLTGFRISELLSLTPRSLDRAARTATVPEKACRGPGDRSGVRHLGDAAWRLLLRLARHRGADEPLFRNRRGRPWTRFAAAQARGPARPPIDGDGGAGLRPHGQTSRPPAESSRSNPAGVTGPDRLSRHDGPDQTRLNQTRRDRT
jgi:integrase